MSETLATPTRATPKYVIEKTKPSVIANDGELHCVSNRSANEVGAVADKALEFNWVKSRADFDALEDDWNDLFEIAGQGNQVFQTFAWCWHWCNAFLDKDGKDAHQLSILTARQNGRLIMVWPLVITKKTGLKVLAWMGEPVSQYGDVLVDTTASNTVLQQAWALLQGDGNIDYIQLRRVRADSQIAKLLPAIAATPSNEVLAPSENLAKFENYDTYADQHCSRRARRNRGRLRRRLEERGNIEFRKVEQGAEAKALTIQALELKQIWLVARGRASPALADPRTTKFFTDVAEKSAHQTGYVFRGVFCDGELIAAEIAFQCKGRNALHIIVFDINYEKVGAGIYLLEKTFAAAIEQGIEIYDLLAPGDRYKLEWCDDTVVVQDWARGVSFAGHVWCRVYLNFLRGWMKNIWNWMPLTLRQQFKKLFER
ncbi:MAG: GNAT family N-acetyltransferase [Hyphomicrobiaceae bacterium]